MKKWPRLDANLILFFEILLMLAILFMNAFDQLLQVRQVPGFVNTGPFYISRIIIFPFIDHLPTAIALASERFFWWFHIAGICGFAIYITYSKHLHIFLAFPNTYFSRNTAVASIANMDSVTREVRHMMGITDANSNYTDPTPVRFGARDIQDLTRKNLLESFSCTECGRCTSVCPANQTGKKLSPRKIMMDVRDRAEELTRNQGKDTEKLQNFLLDHYISREEIFACTTCYACTGICPVNIDPVSVIIQIRQFLVMEESGGPASWNSMFMNMETNESPWKVAQSERINWMD
jgi:ferredoxin